MPKKETTKELVPFDIETAVIVALENKYKNIQITDGKSYNLVMAGIAAYRDLRLSVVDGHKIEKKQLLEDCNFLDSEKRRILARLAPGEDKLKAIRKAWDDEKERVKAEKAHIEQQRVQEIHTKISLISASSHGYQTMTVEKLREVSGQLEAMDITKKDFAEFTAEATTVLDDTYNIVLDMINTRIKLDKEAAERKVESERLEKVRKEQAAAQAKIDEENRKIHEKNVLLAQEAKELETKKKAEEERKEREEFERQAKEKAEADAVENARQKAEEAEALAAVKAEDEARQESLKPDKEKLIKFAGKLIDMLLALPKVESPKAQKILQEITNKLGELNLYIKEQAEKL